MINICQLQYSFRSCYFFVVLHCVVSGYSIMRNVPCVTECYRGNVWNWNLKHFRVGWGFTESCKNWWSPTGGVLHVKLHRFLVSAPTCTRSSSVPHGVRVYVHHKNKWIDFRRRFFFQFWKLHSTHKYALRKYSACIPTAVIKCLNFIFDDMIVNTSCSDQKSWNCSHV